VGGILCHCLRHCWSWNFGQLGQPCGANKAKPEGRDVRLPARSGSLQPLRPDISLTSSIRHVVRARRRSLHYGLLPSSSDVAADKLVYGEQRVHHHLHDGQQIYLHIQTHRLSKTSYPEKCPGVHQSVIFLRDHISHPTLLSEQGGQTLRGTVRVKLYTRTPQWHKVYLES